MKAAFHLHKEGNKYRLSEHTPGLFGYPVNDHGLFNSHDDAYQFTENLAQQRGWTGMMDYAIYMD